METCKTDLFKIFQGEDRDLPIQITRKNGGSFDLRNITEISVYFPAEADPLVPLVLTLGGGEVAITDAVAGRFSVHFSDTNSALLRVDSSPQDLTVVLDEGAHPGGTRRIVPFKEALLVQKQTLV